MIITETKPFGIIKAQLSHGTITLVSCNQCARLCETGGKIGLEKMKKKLKKENYSLYNEFLFSPVCNKSKSKKIITSTGDVILVLACSAGVAAIKKLFENKKVIPALTTIGLGAFDADGNIFMVERLNETVEKY